jgi:hypothetical protein
MNEAMAQKQRHVPEPTTRKYAFPDGFAYTYTYYDNLQDGLSHGTGSTAWPDEATLKGQYENGKTEGKSYTGEFLNGKRHGHGVMTWSTEESMLETM